MAFRRALQRGVWHGIVAGRRFPPHGSQVRLAGSFMVDRTTVGGAPGAFRPCAFRHLSCRPWSRDFFSGPNAPMTRGQRKQMEDSYRGAWWYGAIAMSIFAGVFALVPLYKLYCQATGQGQADFEEHYGLVNDHLFFECVDDQGGGQGCAVAEVVKKYRADKDGAFVQLRRRTSKRHEDDSHEESSQLHKARGTVGAVARGQEAVRKHRPTPLDLMLDDDAEDPMKSQAEDRFEELRKTLEEKKRAKGDASAVLAKRVMEAPEGSGKKRKKESEKSKVSKALKILGGKSAQEGSSSETDSEDDEEAYLRGGGKDSDLLGRQRKLKRMSANKPGCLLARGFGLMHEQLGTMYGDKGQAVDKEALLQPAALRYLLSCALPLTDVRKLGEERLRELRTLATSLDHLVSGKIGLTGDLLMQRMKSILMGIRDGSTTASRYLELIPMEAYPMASTNEEMDFARGLAVRHAKSEKLLEQAGDRERKPALRSPRRRSPIPRKVQFDPRERDIPADPGDNNPHLMRMKAAREAVPRKDGETRQQWKSRVFQFKSKHEEQKEKGAGSRMKAEQSGLLVASNLVTGPDKKKGRQQLGRLVIDRWVEGFCSEPQQEVVLPVFPELVKSRSVDYSGDEVGHALPLRLEELLPGLPVEGVAGSLSAVLAATGAIKEWVEDPSLTLKPPEEWPQVVPKARINATKEEWYRVCGVLFERGIIEPIPLCKVFHAHGVPVLNGAFSIEKKGSAEGSATRVTRLIMNFVPANTYQRLMAGDLGTLSSSSAWCQVILGGDEIIVWSGGDQCGAFYAWQLPASWRPYMAFAWPIPGHLVGSTQSWEYVASRVIPMGWVQAVSLFQHLHRQLGMCREPEGAGHSEELEWRRDKPIQFYLDDFDCPEVVPSEGWEEKRGTMSSTHLRQRAAYARWGVGIAEKKAHLREPKVIRMGAEIDGKRGTVGAPMQKKLEVAFFAIWLMSLRAPPTKNRLMVLGRLVRCFEFRRPLMALLSAVWPKGDLQIRRPLSASCIQELLSSLAVLPIAGTDLRAGVSRQVTCSDASEAGGGLCASEGLSDEGHAMLQQLQSPAFRRDRVLPFAAQGAMSNRSAEGPRILVVSLFDGIAALMVALCRLRCRVVAFASSEVDADCKRLVRRRWPGVIEMGDIEKISQEDLDNLSRSCGHTLDLVLAGGGSPCQDLSVLVANRQGLQGTRSRLFFEMPRIFTGLKAAFHCPVYTFVENVFSMTEANRDQFSEVLGVQPVLIDCPAFTQCRRPRLFWVDWAVQPAEQEKMIQRQGYKEWVFPPLLEDRDWWLDPLCRRACKDPLPTLTDQGSA
eukprot:s256_g22.t1